MKYIVTLTLFLTLTASGMAQITLKYGDYASMLGSQSSTAYTADIANPVSFDIGELGGGQTWDLTGFTFSSQTSNSTFIDPSTTPYTSQFPAATHAATSGSIFIYMLLDQGGFYLLGIAGVITGIEVVLQNDPPKPEMIFPGMLSSSWTYDGNPVPLPAGSGTQQTRSESQIDGEGTLIIPGGSYECLRIRTTDWVTRKFVNGPSVFENISKSVTYTLMTQSGVNASIVADTSSPTTGAIMASSIVYTRLGGQTGISDIVLADDYALRAAYPNPVSVGGPTTVAWNLPAGGNVSVAVYDTRGREVALVFEGRLNAGAHTHSISTAGFAPGMYLVRLNAGGKVLSSPLAIIR